MDVINQLSGVVIVGGEAVTLVKVMEECCLAVSNEAVMAQKQKSVKSNVERSTPNGGVVDQELRMDPCKIDDND